MSFIQRMRYFTPLVWVLIGGTFLTRAAFFMIWPYLAVILHDRFALPESWIGGILGVSALTGTLIGFFVGNLTDRIGRSRVMLTGCALAISAFLLLAGADTPQIFMIAAMLSGSSRALFEAPAKALISDQLAACQVREFAFQVRYFLLNLGAAAGPLAGLALGLTAQQSTFYLLAITYVLFTVALVICFIRTPEIRPERAADAGLRQAVRVLRADKAFLLLILANIGIMYAYAQQDSSLVQYLTQADSQRAIWLFTWLMATNAMTVVLFQFPLLALMDNWALSRRVQLGLILMGTAFVLYTLLPADSATLSWIAATFVLSLGEVILFPTLNLQIDRMAPAHLKGSYFGAAGFYAFGFAAGPALGGVILQYFGGTALFLSTAGVCVVVGYLYLIAGRLERAASDALVPEETAAESLQAGTV